MMGGWGLVLSVLGAGIVAWGQIDIARAVHLWLTALELGKDTKNSRGDIYNVIADKRMKRAVRLNQWRAPVGWTILILGLLLQLAAYFRQYGWKALGL